MDAPQPSSSAADLQAVWGKRELPVLASVARFKTS